MDKLENTRSRVRCICSLFGHLFWNKRSFWQQCQIISRHICKLSANDRRQTETLLHHVSLAAQCLGSIIGRMHRVAMTATMYSENAMSTTQLLGAASHILGVRVMPFVVDPIVTVKCRTAIKELFLYFNLCLKCKVG